MPDDDLLMLGGADVACLLEGRETELVASVRGAYEAHARTQTSLPHSVFLTFPDNARNRIIALPAYVGDGFDIAGVKWISSFPANVGRGIERASAIVVVNSMETGRPLAVMEGSLISAKRTAASAALAAQQLHGPGGPVSLGLVGCGRINYEIQRFLLATGPAPEQVLVHDLAADRAERFAARLNAEAGRQVARAAGDLAGLLRGCDLVSFATTAPTPHVEDLSVCAPGATILHVSLRDLSPAAILDSDNVVDDVDHVCRERTSIHLAAEQRGAVDFVRCTLGDVLLGRQPAREGSRRLVFSPFGLGVLDLGVAALVLRGAEEQGLGTTMPSFWPRSWASAG